MADVRISARSTLTALNRWVEVISGNLVGSQITGYKSTRITFGDSLVDIIRGGSGNAVSLGGINPVQVASGGITVGGTTTDFRQGSLLQTGNDSDVAIQGNAFFTVANSSGGIIYTRSGEFTYDDQGYLVNKEGQYVLGLYDKTRQIKDRDLDRYSDLGKIPTSLPSSTVDFATSNLSGTDARSGAASGATASLASIFGYSTAASGDGSSIMTITKYFVNPNVANEDRVVGRTYVPGGTMTVGTGATAGSLSCASTGGAPIGVIAGLTVNLFIPDAANIATRTSSDNARLIAKAINALSDQTGIGASVVVNLNDQNQATLVIGNVNRVISESFARLPTNYAPATIKTDRALEQITTTNQTGIVGNFRDNKGNLFYQVNSLTLSESAPQYVASPGDKYHFDSTGSIINDSRGKDPESAPPYNTGIHIALSKFSNDQGLQKRRGGSQFLYTEATGSISTGYAGMSKLSQISTITATEVDGSSSIGLENVIVSQSLEASNSSVTDSLPELTVAQKTFTSNTKVVNVGNTIVDDLNGLIR